MLEKSNEERDLVPLEEPEIRKALIGQRLTVDREIDWAPNKVGVAFEETFLPDGRWSINKAVRAVIVQNGK